MSDQFNEFDQILRDRLRDHTTTPPASVWDNIQSERSFGHVVANKISSSWRIIGTFLLLTLAGGTSAYLLQNEHPDQHTLNSNQLNSTPVDQDPILQENSLTYERVFQTEVETPSTPKVKASSTKDAHQQNLNEPESFELYADPDLFASSFYGAFGKPQISDPHLSALIDEMDGWGTAKPSSIVRFYQMNKLDQKALDGNRLVKSPLVPEEQFDYVIESTQKKGFRERSTLHFYIGPQFIQKILTPEYNMSTSFLERRQETENTRLAYTAGINLQYELKNNKFFETGVQFTEIYEEVRIDGDKRFSNQYDFIEVPLLIGYQDRESKWGWSVKGGLGLQVYNSYKGYQLKNVEDRISSAKPANDDVYNGEYRISGSTYVNTVVKNNHTLSDKQDRNEVYDLSSSENPYREFGVVNLHLAAGVTYFHSINTSFSITPYYRQSINSLTKEEANFKERITYMGVLFGTRVNF
jgi:hypothetical protein